MHIQARTRLISLLQNFYNLLTLFSLICDIRGHRMPPMNFMRNNRWLQQRLVAVVACVSVLLSALAPTISHAMVSGNVPAGMIKVCSSSGDKFIPASFLTAKNNLGITDTLPNSRSNETKTTAACAYCDQHAGSYTILSIVHYNFNVADLSSHYAELYYHQPLSYFHSSPPSSRAPPAYLS